jgi:hypothetical protein
MALQASKLLGFGQFRRIYQNDTIWGLKTGG